MTGKVHESNGKCLFSVRSKESSGIQLPRGFYRQNGSGESARTTRTVTRYFMELRRSIRFWSESMRRMKPRRGYSISRVA